MSNRDRLIELFKKIEYKPFPNAGTKYNLSHQFTDYALESIIDCLITNGVILPPCKIGDKVWFIRKDRVPDDDYRMSFHDEWVLCEVSFQLSMINQIGKTVFLTREEAEKALNEEK